MDRRIAQVLEVMAQQLSEPLAVARLASMVNLSPSRFAHLFRQAVGVSPRRYLDALRLRRAAALLAATSLPVNEVMRAVGWTDPSHFSKTFRRRFGMSPRHYRERGQQNPPTRCEPSWPTGLPASIEITRGDDRNE